ncbi:MAG: GTPase ObgE [Candidatus Pacebacteria bacterium]|nr:GTPase ObgE [Candidatus Paceibacterota bacterium]MBP9840709.1 GTPase ObgE [Candidatus Paceibacterota bacterium]
MAFVDQITVGAKAGKGGDGVIRWLRTKETAMGGPSGGDGGRGGDVIVVGVHDLAALANFQYEKKFRARDGEPGDNFNRHGKDGAPVILHVPVGTLVENLATGDSFEINEPGQSVVAFEGGSGGRGNINFKSSTNQNPFQKTDGKPGGEGELRLTLKLIAEAGFIGFPNAGKSSLLNALTRAKSRIGAYPFTTLDPHLGDFYGRILADIPGLIEGASAGKGLGSKFLKHVERTKMLVHLVSAEQDDVATAYRAVRKELEAFGHGLPQKRELVVLSKVDLLTDVERENRLKELGEVAGKGAVTVSVEDPEVLKAFSDLLAKELEASGK